MPRRLQIFAGRQPIRVQLRTRSLCQHHCTICAYTLVSHTASSNEYIRIVWRFIASTPIHSVPPSAPTSSITGQRISALVHIEHLMISRVRRGVLRLALWLVVATICVYILLFIVVAISRYERTEGSCPNMSLATLRKQLLVRLLDEHGIPPDRIRFDGAPQYHAWKLGVWEFPLRVDEIRYTAMIDCNEQLSSYGRTIDRPLDQTGQAHARQ